MGASDTARCARIHTPNTIGGQPLTVYLIPGEAHRGMSKPSNWDRWEKQTIVRRFTSGANGVPPVPWPASERPPRVCGRMRGACCVTDTTSAAMGVLVGFVRQDAMQTTTDSGRPA